MTRKMSLKKSKRVRKQRRTRTSQGPAYWLSLMAQPPRRVSPPPRMRNPGLSQRLRKRGPRLYRRLHPLPSGALWLSSPNSRQSIPTSSPFRSPMPLRARVKKSYLPPRDHPRAPSRQSQRQQQQHPWALISITRSIKRPQHLSRMVNGQIVSGTGARSQVYLLSIATSQMQMTRTRCGQNATRKTKTGTLSRLMAKNVTGRGAIACLHAGSLIGIGLRSSVRVQHRTVRALADQAREQDYPPSSMALILRVLPQRNAVDAPVPCISVARPRPSYAPSRLRPLQRGRQSRQVNWS